MGRGSAELRDNALRIGHRGRGGGVRYSLQELERATIFDRIQSKGIWYVNSTVASGRPGTGWEDAFTTIEEAVDTAAAGDYILVAPLHVETVTAAAGLVLDKAGLKIYGYGNGNRRPQVNFTTAVGADMDVSAADILMYNMRFTGGVDALTGPIDVNAAGFTMVDCVTEDVTGQATDFIVSDANADRMKLIRWDHRGAAAAGADSAIQITGGDEIVIEDAWIYGNFAAAGIETITTAQVNLRVYGGARRPCYIWTENAADVAITCVTGATGDLGPHIYARLQDDAANVTEAFVGDAMRFMQPIMIVNADGQRNIETNITASAG
jgi:hypothetical protein